MRISDWISDVCSSDLAQPRHPAQLVIELGPGLRIAVGQIDRCDAQAMNIGLQIARLLILGFAREAALNLDRIGTPGENRDAVEALLPVIEEAVARRLDLLGRHRLVARFRSEEHTSELQ